MFIEVYDRGLRKEVAVNTSHIISIEDDGEGSIIYLDDNRIICAHESYAEVWCKVKAI